MTALEQSRVREIAAQILENHGRTSVSSFVSHRMAAVLDDDDFTDTEWDQAVMAVRDAIKTAAVAASWPEPVGDPFADRTRWYPVLFTIDGDVEPNPERWFAAEDRDYWKASPLADMVSRDVVAVAATGHELPGRTGASWIMPVTWRPDPDDTEPPRDPAKCVFTIGNFRDWEAVRQGWLDAVAVATSRNQRAESDG